MREFKTGQILCDQPYDDNLDGSSVFANGRDIVSELRFEPPPLRQLDYLYHQNERLIRENHHDGSHVHLPGNHYIYFQAYKSSPDYDGNGESDDSHMSCDDMRVGIQPKDQKTSLSRIEQRALDKELPVDFIMP